MAGRISVFEIDVRQLEGLAANLGELSGDRLAEVSANAINEVIDRTDKNVRAAITGTINLNAAYLQDRLAVGHAHKTLLEARIYAPFRHTSLGRYDAKPIMQKAKSPLRRLKGNPGLGIPRGMKLAAVSVEVVRGARKTMVNETAFLSPTLKNSSDEPMIFTTIPIKGKNKKDKLRARYGPSVYQLFRVARDNQMDEVATDLQLTLLAEAEAAIDEAFK